MYPLGMLIDLGLRLVVSPSEYVGTLAIRLQTDDLPGYGLRSGQHAGFRPGEGNQDVPGIPVGPPDDVLPGVWDYVIDLPRRVQENQVLTYHYVAQGRGSGVYVQYPDVWLLQVTESSSAGWDVAVHRPGHYGFTLILPDYRPGQGIALV